jgi:TonB family protein
MRLRRAMVAVLAVAVMAAPLVLSAQQKPPVRVGGSVKQPVRTSYVAPVYPQEAKQAGIQGLVLVEATIDVDGSVASTKVLRPVPMLEDAAVEAVKQWKYEPTLINGEPVQVVMVVTVSFTLKAAAVPADPPKPPVRVGGSVREPVRTNYVSPVYPDEARQAGVQGVVILEIQLDRDGTVGDVKVLRSVPLLDLAAVEAVKQWKYEPTVIDNEAVQLVMVVTVNFTLK